MSLLIFAPLIAAALVLRRGMVGERVLRTYASWAPLPDPPPPRHAA